MKTAVLTKFTSAVHYFGFLSYASRCIRRVMRIALFALTASAVFTCASALIDHNADDELHRLCRHSGEEDEEAHRMCLHTMTEGTDNGEPSCM